MSQHDFDFTTADGNTGPTVRAGMNAMAQALASCSSGAAEPSTMYAYQFWADTTSGYMKQRNAANTAWLTRWQLSVGQLAALAGATFTGLVNLAAGADIASAATIDLTEATGNCSRITGTTPTSAVTMNTGQWELVVADGAWPLTYDATTNKLNTGASYTCKAGDVIFYHKDSSGVVHGEISRPTGVAAGNVLQSDQAITTVASASTTVLAGTTEQLITGTSTINIFNGTPGVRHRCRTSGALTLHHDGNVLLVTQVGADITLDAGATFDVYMLTAVTARVTNIAMASGKPVVSEFTNTTTLFPCKAWVHFNAAGTIQASGNVSSVTDNGTGDYTINFADNFADAFYGFNVTAGKGAGFTAPLIAGPSTANPTSSAFRLTVINDSGTPTDPVFCAASFFR